MRITLLFVIIVLLLAPITSTQGQNVANKNFGKNRIQYKEFEWQFYSTDNFDVYYYAGGKELAKIAIEFLEEEFDRITDLLGYAPYAKTKIFLYNSVVDLQQSNIGINDEVFTVGGQTSFIKLQTEIAFPGTVSEFKRELVFNIANMLINDMMFGGSLADMFQSTYLMTLPDWFIQGAARYAAEGWGEEMDNYMRDLLSNTTVKKLDKIEGERAAIAGQSVWNYIANRYGKSNISNVLNLTRIIRNEENSIASTLGVPFKQFLANWQSFYKDASLRIAGSYLEVDPTNVLLKPKQDVKYNQLKFSPDGTRLVYSENYGGKYNVIIKDINTGIKRKVLSGGYRVINQKVDYDIPLLQWIDNENLGIIQSIYGKYYLVSYNIPTKNAQRKSLERFENIKDLAFNDNGRLAVISADANGMNDLYLISMRRNAIRRLTRDQWDDINPKFLPGTDAIVFSSNRTADSLKHPVEKVNKLTNNYNLFLMDMDTSQWGYMRLTNTLSKDHKPVPRSTKEIYYLSDQKGISNIYRYNVQDSIFQQVTGFNNSIINYDIDLNNNNLAFTMLQNGMQRIFLYKNFNFGQSVFTPQTLRKEIEQARTLRERMAAEPPKPLVVDQPLAINLDTAQIKKPEIDEDFIDTDNYQFKDQVEEKANQRNFSFLSNYRKLEKTTSVVGPLPYDTRFSADNVITSFVIDPLRGFGMLLETSMNDMLENHKFFGGILAVSDLKSGDFFGEYQFLKYRVDFKARYNRNVILRDARQEGIWQKYASNTFSVGASLPFTNALRVDVSPHISTTQFIDFDRSALSPTPPNIKTENSVVFAGANLEFVFDNSIVHGLNIYEGTRAKIGFKQFKGLSDNSRSFSNIYLDTRHYQKVHRDITFATRLFYGKFMGNNKPKYMLGGMDNWVFNKTNDTGSNDPLLVATGTDNSNILFHQFVTTLRGFDYNTFNGTNALLLNAELRFPAFRYFMRGPISSNFFRNFQIIGFYDVGSSWTGISPFSKNNDVNTRIIKVEGSPFQAILDNSRSPWLASYGMGLRTVLLGYYLKFDVAKPVQDFIVGPPRLHVTMGYDF